MATSPLVRRLKDRARTLGNRARDEFLASGDRADVLGTAVRGVQSGRRALDDQGMRIAAVFGLATIRDLERVERKIGRMRKRLMTLLDDIDELDGSPD